MFYHKAGKSMSKFEKLENPIFSNLSKVNISCRPKIVWEIRRRMPISPWAWRGFPLDQDCFDMS
jgi:hypothetical protein